MGTPPYTFKVEQRGKIPNREWLAVVFPVGCAAILLIAAFANATGQRYGWVAVLICFVAGAAFPLSYTLVLLRERRLYLRDERDIERNRSRIVAGQSIGWLLGACFLAAGAAVGGVSKASLLAFLAGLAFGFWPGFLANFLRLRREHHWG